MATATDGVGAVQAEQSKVWEWLTTVDHKKIGTMYGITGFTYFLIPLWLYEPSWLYQMEMF